MNTHEHDIGAATISFCNMIKIRSEENRRAMNSFYSHHCVLSPAFSILRQELDSLIRVIYLLKINDLSERNRLIQLTLNGKEWNTKTEKGKFRKITDREMVDISQILQSWTQSVYKFGCAFIHLSDFHNHLAEDPFHKLSVEERNDVLMHMRYYHGGPLHDNPDMREISEYLPNIFEKISGNLRFYVEELRKGEIDCE